MKKKLSLTLAAAMMLSSLGSVSYAESTAPTARFTDYDQVNAAITVIPATDTQAELGYLDGVTPILEVDGLKFKDLNGNGQLDVYEDWRQEQDARVKDLYDQMTLEEKAGLFYHVNTCGNPQGVDFADSRYMFSNESTVPDENATFESKSMWYYINELKITSHLDNTNGTPAQQIVYHNAMQALAEDTRLGIPVVISNDRQYNAWGGMIDTAHDAFGAANDLELSEKLWTAYSLESRAVGIHVVLHPYSQELGSWNGEDPEYAGNMTKAEVAAIQVEGGTEACMKHFIARGGDSSFQNARSDAQTVDNWMTAWKIALESNPKWVMTNGYGTGLTNTVHVDYDKETMDYLRNTLGYDGIIVSDWGDQGDSNSGGTTVDGVEILSLSIPERYAYVINNGLDQIGAFACDYESDGHGGQASRSGINEALLHDFDFLDRHLVGRGTTGRYRHLAGGPGLAGCGRGTFGAVVVQLDKAAAVVLVDGLGQGLEGGGVLVTSQGHLQIPGLIVHLVHIHTLDDNQAHAAPGTLFIIGDSLFAGITLVFAVHHLHGGQYSTVLDGQFTDLAGSKEFIHRAFLLK